jgi:hypothetical protein
MVSVIVGHQRITFGDSLDSRRSWVRASSGRSSGRTNMLVIDDSVVRALEAVDIPEAAFKESADEVGEAVVQISHDQTTSPLRDFGARDR